MYNIQYFIIYTLAIYTLTSGVMSFGVLILIATGAPLYCPLYTAAVLPVPTRSFASR